MTSSNNSKISSQTTEIEKTPMKSSRVDSPYTAKDPSHGFFLWSGLTWMQKEERFCDVTLKIGKDRKLRAHRAVLALSSKYFEALFGANWVEGKSNEVELLDFDEDAITSLVRFVYSGTVDITTDNVQYILEVANYLGIEFVQKECIRFLEENLNKNNCLNALQIADTFAFEYLREEAKLVAVRYFTEICMTQDFIHLPHHLLTELLREESICVVVDNLIPRADKRESVVLQAVFRYVQYDLGKRADLLPKLLALVRLPTLSKEHLQEVSKHSLIIGCRCEAIVEKAMTVKSNETGDGSTDSNWAKRRDFAKCVVTWGRTFVGTQQIPSKKKFITGRYFLEDSIDGVNDEGVYITGITVWRNCPTEEPRSICGLEVFYSNNSRWLYGVKSGQKQNEIFLKENEKIVKVEVQSGTLINSLAFYTNKDSYGGLKSYRGFCPDYQGSCQGSHATVRSQSPPGICGFLAGVAGETCEFQGQPCITRLQFAWKTFVCNDVAITPRFEYFEPGKCEIVNRPLKPCQKQ